MIIRTPLGVRLKTSRLFGRRFNGVSFRKIRKIINNWEVRRLRLGLYTFENNSNGARYGKAGRNYNVWLYRDAIQIGCSLFKLEDIEFIKTLVI